MKYFYYFLIVIFIGLILYNVYPIDFSQPFSEKNYLSWITVLSSICGLLLTIIMFKVIGVKDKKNDTKS